MRRRRRTRDAGVGDPSAGAGPVPDDLPRRGLFAEPIRVDRIEVLAPEAVGNGDVRVTFRATVKDAAGKRCPDIAVEARVSGPERVADGLSTTDLMGQVRIRMTGPPGAYICELLDVGAGGLELDRDASTLTAHIDAT